MNGASAARMLGSYVRVRAFPLAHPTRGLVERWQERRLRRWLRASAGGVAAFRRDGTRGLALGDYPVMDKADLMADFAAYNDAGITAEAAWRAFEGDKRIGPYIVGASTGTSGNRGLFVISQAERSRWVGAILAKALPDFWQHRDRVAVLLPTDTPLYDTANETSLLRVRFFDLGQPLDDIASELRRFAPTVLIAPPRAMRRLAELAPGLPVRRVHCAGEKMEAFDRTAIEAGFGVPPGEIYMATEGLLAVTCAHGRLHLAEDCMHFELEDAGGGLVSPIVTDFSRTTQIMLRYRMNDLLRMADGADRHLCPCGSPLRVVDEVVGRMDDVFHLDARGGAEKGREKGVVEIMPDVLRNTMVDCDRRIEDFRIVQTASDAVTLRLDASVPAHVEPRLRERFAALFARHGCAVDLTVQFAHLEPPRHGKLRHGKLRRVERRHPIIERAHD